MSYTLLHRNELPHDGNTYEFQGAQHGDTNVSFIWVDMPPGGTIRLHKHPCEEIFIIQEGRATLTVGSATLDARRADRYPCEQAVHRALAGRLNTLQFTGKKTNFIEESC